MRLEQFFEKFELFADAPNAVGKMRELVLRLAFSGGLSDTSPDKNGVPIGWETKTIESICSSITPGFACSRNHQVEDGHAHLRTHNISTTGTLNFDLLVRIDPKMVDARKASIRRGDILFNNTNSQELVGKTSLVDRDYEYGFSNHITRLRLTDKAFPGFVVFYLTFLRNSGYFAKLCTRWINQAAVNTETLKRETIPLPPIGEQKRIVAKVNELMALCDRLEAQQREREARHAALARASLTRFSEASTPANLGFIFHQVYSVTPADLRTTVLILAVRGKLVAQDPNDEPAKTCLAEPTSLNCSDLPDLPSGWIWTRVDEAGRVDLGRQRAPQHHRGPNMRPYLRVQNVYEARIDVSDVKEMNFTPAEFKTFALQSGDLLLNEGQSRELVGRPAIYRDEVPGACFQNTLVRFRHREFVLPEYALVVFRAYMHSGKFQAISKQTTNIAHLSAGRFSMLEFPLPPLAEQRRIVAKVDQLMVLVDRLETQLAHSHTTAENLLEALVAELTAPRSEVSA